MKLTIRLRYASIALTLLILSLISFLLINNQGKRIFKDPLSAIGNISNNYPVFVIGALITFPLFTTIIYKLYKKENIKVDWKVFSIPVLGIISIIIPYQDNYPVLKNIHTILAAICAYMIIYVIQKYSERNKQNKIIIKIIDYHLPLIAIIGSLILYLFFGLNSLIQLVYISTILLWINFVSYRY
jgi:hypothetical protein